ncbi:hypothetical protein ACSQ67_000260 [Phaseolus vulgaris]
MASQDPTLLKLHSARSDLNTLLQASSEAQHNITQTETRFSLHQQSLSTASRRILPLQSLTMSRKALDARITRAVSPAVELLNTFKRTEGLQAKLVTFSAELSSEKSQQRRLEKLVEYVGCVEEVKEGIEKICEEVETVVQRLQEVVEFVSRTKAADQGRDVRLKDALVTLKVLYEREVDEMRFEGLLDQALLHVQDEFEELLLRMKHRNLRDSVNHNGGEERELGSEMEVQALTRISTTLAANDCMDICIDIYLKARYRRAAKALMKLNPDYLRTYTPEGIDEMEWETLETAITLWIQHFEVAVKKVLLSEKKLCEKVLGDFMEGLVWPECFIKISDKIMAVFFRFGEGVARSSKEPQKLFKLLDMFESLEKLKPQISQIFEGESGADICTRFRELEKLIIDASSKVFWEFGLQIEGNIDGLPPPQDGSVPKLVRYAINYLKYLTTVNYKTSMIKILRTQQTWRGKGGSSETGGNETLTDEDLLKHAISNVMEALQRNIESKRECCRDKVLVHVFTMNTYWYIYMRTKNTQLEASVGGLVKVLDGEDLREEGKGSVGRVVSEKVETFFKGLNEVCEKHGRGVYSIPDVDLREQMREATLRVVVPAYAEFLESYSEFLNKKGYPSVERVKGLVVKAFDGGRLRRKGSAASGDWNVARNSGSLERE